MAVAERVAHAHLIGVEILRIYRPIVHVNALLSHAYRIRGLINECISNIPFDSCAATAAASIAFHMEGFLRAAAQRAADAEPLRRAALPLAAESAEAAVGRGMRAHATFSYRGVDVSYSELPDAASNLLFGNVCWPCAEVLARLLVDGARGGCKVWTQSACAQLGVPLEALLCRRFGLSYVPPAPTPAALDRLGLSTIVPDVSCRMSVLEVGAGVGLTGLACHALGASVLLTDGEERLVEALRARHGSVGNDGAAATAGGGGGSEDAPPRLRFATLDWHAPDDDGERFDLILGVEVLNPACAGEVHVPRLIGRALRRAPECRALLLSEVRRSETCATAVRELQAHGLRVAAFRVVGGREAFEVPLEAMEVGAMVLLVACW